MSTEIDQAAMLRQELAQRQGEHGHRVYLEISEEEAEDMAAGCLPKAVQAQARFAVR